LLPNPVQLGIVRATGPERVLNFIGLVVGWLPVPPEDKPPKRLTTVLLPVRVGDVWRVQIVWPNGSVHYFGTFNSKESAAEWIAAHAWMTVRSDRPGEPPA
jgi:hypothetical protein